MSARLAHGGSLSAAVGSETAAVGGDGREPVMRGQFGSEAVHMVRGGHTEASPIGSA